MRTKQLFTYTLLFFTLLFFSACDKDDPNLTNTDLLVASEWKGDQVLVNGVDVSERQEVIQEIGRIKTARIKFDRNGTYTATFDNNEGTQTQNGTWQFGEDEKTITFNLYGEVSVVRLTDKNLDFMDKIPFQGVLFDAEVKFVK